MLATYSQHERSVRVGALALPDSLRLNVSAEELGETLPGGGRRLRAAVALGLLRCSGALPSGGAGNLSLPADVTQQLAGLAAAANLTLGGGNSSVADLNGDGEVDEQDAQQLLDSLGGLAAGGGLGGILTGQLLGTSKTFPRHFRDTP